MIIFNNMKKFILCLISLLIMCPVYSDDFFDNYTGIDNAWDGQKPITNKEFEEAIETLQAKQKQKEAKLKKKKIKKISGGGTSLHSGLDPVSEIQEQVPVKKDENEGRLINIPVDMIIDGKILERGYYNLFGEKDKDNNVYISFYQSQFFKGKVKAKETNDDFGAETIDFAKYEPCKDYYIKVIFGSLDFNAYAYVMYSPETQE